MKTRKTIFILVSAMSISAMACSTSQETTYNHKDGGAQDTNTDPSNSSDGGKVNNNPLNVNLNQSQLPSCFDSKQNQDETDVDCGGSNCAPCSLSQKCTLDSDCNTPACDYTGHCIDVRSCKNQMGGSTCGSSNSQESCCISLPIPGMTGKLDKYNITAGRFRVFVNDTNGDIKGWLTNHMPVDWPSSWTQYLPSVLDNGGVSPDDSPAYSGVYQELGPEVHGEAGAGNEGCYIKGNGARTFRLPDAVNARMGDPQYYSQDDLDQRPLNCVSVAILAAFCSWDTGGNGRIATRDELDAAWGSFKYPWGDLPDPAGYDTAYPTDPLGTYGSEAYGTMGSSPLVSAPFSISDTLLANYNYNYWGGEIFSTTDYSVFISPPGRFPMGNSASGHADLAGNVFNSTYPENSDEAALTYAYWSKSGSWQGHQIPFSDPPSFWTSTIMSKYWAMGSRCVRQN